MTRTHHRAAGSGTIYRDGARWRAELLIEITPDGKQRRWRGRYRTRREAEAALAQAIAAHGKGQLVLPSEQTVGDYLAEWLEQVARPRVAASTYQRYRELVAGQTGGLGNIRLDKLNPRDLQAHYNRLSERYQPSTILKVHRLLHSALRTAVEWGLISYNPCDRVRPPRQQVREGIALTPEQARALVTALKGHPWEAYYLLALTGGLRPGELRALRWCDCDLTQGVITVQRSAVRVRGAGWLIKDTKTHQARAVALPALTLEALKRHRLRSQYTASSDLVFANAKGQPVEAQNLARRVWQPLLAQAGLPRIRPYDLRHTTASLLGALGAHPKVLQELLGHSSPTVTLGVYTHTLPTLHREAVERLGELLSSDS